MKSFSWIFLKEFALLVFLGLLVAVIVKPILELDSIRQVDLTVSDILMRWRAHDHVEHPGAAPLRYVFVNIGERTCRQWAQGAACSATFTIPRQRLAEIADEVSLTTRGASGAPRLVVFDIELAPLPSPANAYDASLCSAVARLSHRVPVVGIRPLVAEAGADGSEIHSLPSIFDPAINGEAGCEGERSAGIGLGASLVHMDFDGAVRSVDQWVMARTDDKHSIVVPGMGFLGAALLSQTSKPPSIDCVLEAGRTTPCAPHPLHVGTQSYALPHEPSEPDRILFTIPYGQSGRRGIENYGYTPSVVESIEAVDFASRLASNQNLLENAVVIVGDSYAASGDLYRTPLNSQFPGAMIHANAINAYATENGVIREQHSWRLEMLLVAIAAFTGALFHAVSQRYVEHLPWPLNGVLEMSIAIVGAGASILVVLAACVLLAYSRLGNGLLIGTVTPALCVALEGFSTFLHHIRQLIHAARNPFSALKGGTAQPHEH